MLECRHVFLVLGGERHPALNAEQLGLTARAQLRRRSLGMGDAATRRVWRNSYTFDVRDEHDSPSQSLNTKGLYLLRLTANAFDQPICPISRRIDDLEIDFFFQAL